MDFQSSARHPSSGLGSLSWAAAGHQKTWLRTALSFVSMCPTLPASICLAPRANTPATQTQQIGEYALDMQVIAGATDGLVGLYLVGILPQLRAGISMSYMVHVCHHTKRFL